jgi:hypothetical protein
MWQRARAKKPPFLAAGLTASHRTGLIGCLDCSSWHLHVPPWERRAASRAASLGQWLQLSAAPRQRDSLQWWDCCIYCLRLGFMVSGVRRARSSVRRGPVVKHANMGWPPLALSEPSSQLCMECSAGQQDGVSHTSGAEPRRAQGGSC